MDAKLFSVELLTQGQQTEAENDEIDENDEEDIVFEHERWSQDSKTNGLDEKLLELCYSLEMTIWNGLFDRKGGEFTFVSHSGSSVVDYFAVNDELLERKPDVSIRERFESKHFPVQMEVGVHDYNIADDSAKETTECKRKRLFGVPIAVTSSQKDLNSWEWRIC